MHNLACKQYKRGDFLHITPSSHQMASPPSITRTQYHLHQLLQHKSILNYNTSVVYDISLLLVKYHHKQYFITSRFSDSITHGTLGIKHHEGNATILVPNGNTQNLSSKLYQEKNEMKPIGFTCINASKTEVKYSRVSLLLIIRTLKHLAGNTNCSTHNYKPI